MKNNNNSKSVLNLEKAEKLLEKVKGAQAEIQMVLEELHNRNNELKLRNEELVVAKTEAEAAKEKYDELINFSVGALDESRKLYEDLVSNQSAGIYRMLVQKQETGRSIIESASMEYVSDRFCDHFEVEKAGFLTNAIAEAFSKIHPDDIRDFIISNEIAQQSLEPYIRETRLLIGDRIKWLRFESSPRKLENGSTRWTGVTIDITKQKLDEEALKRKISELEIYYELAITREHKMIALKSEINLLLQSAGEKAKY